MTTQPTEDSLREHFEANMLDGDNVYDCGGAMLSAASVWEYIRDFMPELIALYAPKPDEKSEQGSDSSFSVQQKNADETVESILRDNTTHYERTCMFCGYTWLGLHCPHDRYQNPCPNCNKKPSTIDYYDCTCKGVTDLDDVVQALDAHYAAKEQEAYIAGVNADKRSVQEAVLRARIEELSPLCEHQDGCKTLESYYGEGNKYPYKDPIECFDYLCTCGAVRAIDRIAALTNQLNKMNGDS